MNLFVRLIRALALFGLILSSYLVQMGLERVFRSREADAATGRSRWVDPPWLVERRTRIDRRNAVRLRAGMLRLRGVYIKLGQVLSIVGVFLPRVYTKELEQLQDRVPPHPFEDVERTFVESLGKRPDELFASFEREPVAAASLGQVHVATLPTGEKVAVKVLYPGIRDIIRVDMRVVRLALHVYEWFFPVRNLERAHEALVDLLRRETDLVHEADCMERLAKNFEDEDDILCPSVVRDRSSRDILTMTFMEGIKITRVDELRAAGIDPDAVARRLATMFYKQLFVHRFFHADPHPGNFLVQAGPEPDEPRIVVLDFGAISEVRKEMVDGLLDILHGLLNEEPDVLLSGFYQMGFASKEGNRELLERTVMTYFQKLLKVKDRTASALMRAKTEDLEQLANPELEREELRELMRSVDYPEGWFYVERASVLMFWLCGQIAPDVDTMQVGYPYVVPLLFQRQQIRASQRPPAA